LSRGNAGGTIAPLARGFGYVVNYPDGTQTSHNLAGGVSLKRAGDELLDGWLIDRIQHATTASSTRDGLPILYEVWVKPVQPT
jgi:hypothetical protein